MSNEKASSDEQGLHQSVMCSDKITKRQMTICNLFANHELSIPDIVRVLDETYDTLSVF
jgi:hypothetical protein